MAFSILRLRLPLAPRMLAVATLALLAADAPPAPTAPGPLAVAKDGSLYIADTRLPLVFRRDSTARLEVVARGNPRERSPLRAVSALAVGRDGTLFAADRATSEVYRVRPGRPPSPLAGGALDLPVGLIVTPEGDLVVADLKLGIVAVIPEAGGSPRTLAHVPSPRGVASGPSGGLAVLSMGRDQLLRIPSSGEVRPIVTGRPFRFPTALIRDQAGTGYLVADSYSATVWGVSDDGKVRAAHQGKPLVRPTGLALHPSGDVLIGDPGAGQVFRASPNGRIEPLLGRP